MKTIIQNERQLDLIVSDLYNRFDEWKSMNIIYEKTSAPKTIKQTGFIFGAIIRGLVDTFNDPSKDEDFFKNTFYLACAKQYPDFNRRIITLFGDVKDMPLTLSQMNKEQTSKFIDFVLRLVRTSEYFQDVKLHPSIYYSWVNHITDETLEGLNGLQLPTRCQEYLDFQRDKACIWCGKGQGVEAHHLRNLQDGGVALKPPDWQTIPLCHDCHIGQLHSKGVEAFLNDTRWITSKISLEDFCKLEYLHWKQHL